MNTFSALPAYNLENLNVLVVDGHGQIRAMIREVLRSFGIRSVQDAISIEQGFELVDEIKPDIIFIDWTPEFDGIGLLHKIRTDPDSPDPYVSVIVMTGFAEPHHVHSARDAGMNRYLTKPVSAQTIYKHIVALIDNNKSFINSIEFVGPDRRWKLNPKFNGTEKRALDLHHHS